MTRGLNDFTDLAPPERPRGPLVPLEPPKADEPKGLRKVNGARLASRRAACFGPQARLARLLPCVACGKPPPSQAAHVKSRGAGGRDSECVPLCARCHDRQGVEGIETFQRKRRLDLPELARRMADRVRDHARDGGCTDWPEQGPRGLRCRVCLRPLDARDIKPEARP